nr:hypothetical protein [uncultured Desulfobulbus sp.]
MNPQFDPIIYEGGKKLPRINRKVKYLLRLFNAGIRLSRPFLLQSLGYSAKVDIRQGINFTSGQVFCEGKAALSDTFFVDYAPVYIGENAGFSFQNTVVTSTHDPLDRDRVLTQPIYLERNVWITTNVTILGGVRIGENSIIGAGSVVCRDIPPNVFAAGNPCKPIKPITP